jgi:hypothetical protein
MIEREPRATTLTLISRAAAYGRVARPVEDEPLHVIIADEGRGHGRQASPVDRPVAGASSRQGSTSNKGVPQSRTKVWEPIMSPGSTTSASRFNTSLYAGLPSCPIALRLAPDSVRSGCGSQRGPA